MRPENQLEQTASSNAYLELSRPAPGVCDSLQASLPRGCVEGILQNQDNVISIKASRVASIFVSAAETLSHDFH